MGYLSVVLVALFIGVVGGLFIAGLLKSSEDIKLNNEK